MEEYLPFFVPNSLWVSVIPRSDAESRRKHGKDLVAYTGFRVGARNDRYPQTDRS